MLGSAFEADDAVQETLCERVEQLANVEVVGGSGVAYRIDTKVCFDMLNSARRARRWTLVTKPFSHAWGRFSEITWIQPITDGRALSVR